MGIGANMIALLLFFCCTSAHSVELGRLFTTGEERRLLDRPPGKANPPVYRAIKTQGLISRRGGEPTAWVDGRPLQRGDAGEGFVLLDAGREGALILRDSAPPPDPAADDEPEAAP